MDNTDYSKQNIKNDVLLLLVKYCAFKLTREIATDIYLRSTEPMHWRNGNYFDTYPRRKSTSRQESVQMAGICQNLNHVAVSLFGESKTIIIDVRV